MATQVQIVASETKSYAQYIRAQLNAAMAAKNCGHLDEMTEAIEALKWAVGKWEYAIKA